MKLLVTAAAIAGTIAFPAFAQDAAMDTSTMTCADFTAMDAEGQMMAMEAMQTSMTDGMASDDATAAGTEEMATDSMAEGTAEMAEGTAETATDSMAEGTDDTTMATDSMAEGTEAGAMASDDPMMTAMMEACAGDPAMMAMDAMTASQAN